MSDLIDRQHAIDEIRFYITEPNISDDETKIEGYNNGLEMAISILSILSSAEPERKKGKWIKEDLSGYLTPGGNSIYHCSECGNVEGLYPHPRLTDFCPNCGADMRGDR